MATGKNDEKNNKIVRVKIWKLRDKFAAGCALVSSIYFKTYPWGIYWRNFPNKLWDNLSSAVQP